MKTRASVQKLCIELTLFERFELRARQSKYIIYVYITKSDMSIKASFPNSYVNRASRQREQAAEAEVVVVPARSRNSSYFHIAGYRGNCPWTHTLIITRSIHLEHSSHGIPPLAFIDLSLILVHYPQIFINTILTLFYLVIKILFNIYYIMIKLLAI